MYIATAGGPYRSDDEGESWKLVDNRLQRHHTLHISAAPDDADVVLVSVSSNAGRQNPQFYRSSNGAAKWHLIEAVGSDDDMVWRLTGTPPTRIEYTQEPRVGASFAAKTEESPGSP